jgi:hypothetical protein
MRKLVLVIAVIIVMAAFAGCLGGEAEKKKSNTPVLVPKNAKSPTQSGWIDDDGNEHASAPITVGLNDTNIVHVKFTIRVDDSDPAHSDSDEGSNPDDVTVTISSGNDTEKKGGPTPFSATIEFNAPGGTEAPEYLDQSWTVQIDADLGGGKPMYFFGLIVWIDQGIAYTVDCEYSYMALEETTGI